MKEPSLLWLLIIPALMLALAGALLIPRLLEGAPSECTADIVSLSAPTVPSLMLAAVEILIEEGVISSVDAAVEAIVDAQYIFDPDEDGELEYWMIFRSGSGMIAAEFNIGCPLNEEGYPLDLQFEGVRAL